MTSVDPKIDIRGRTAAVAGGVRRWRAFALLAVAYFMTAVDLLIVNVALPTIGAELRFAEADLQWVVTAYAITFGGFLLLGGRAADLLGRRRTFTAGLALFTAASLACALATGGTFLIIMRAVQGLGAAAVLPAALSIVMNMFPEGTERNKALGIWGAVGAGGATFGVLAGGALTRYGGWPDIFYLNVVVGGAALPLTRRVVPQSRLPAARRRYDLPGALTVTGALVVAVYAISRAPDTGWTDTRTLALLAGAAALLVAFVVVEAGVEAPLLPLRLFRLKTLAGSNAVGFLLGAGFYGYIFIGTLYMQQVLGYSPMTTGLAWLTVGLTGVVFAGPAQLLVTRTSVKLVMAAGLTLTGTGILWATQTLLEHGLVDKLNFVINPVMAGSGTPLLRPAKRTNLRLISATERRNGAITLSYATT
ncbi:MFS transporter [Spirillospora sp. NPDC127506]